MEAIEPELRAKTKVFHLRGNIDYRQLGFIHKIMMGMMKWMIQGKPESERGADDIVFLKTYDGQIDFVNKDSIEPLVACVQAIVI